MTDLTEALLSYLAAAESFRKAADECRYGGAYFLRDDRDRLARAEGRFLDELTLALKERGDAKA